MRYVSANLGSWRILDPLHYVVQQQTSKKNKNYKTTKQNKKVNQDHVYTAEQLGMNYYINEWVILV